MALLTSIDPSTGDPLEQYETHSASAIEQRLSSAERAQRAWRDRPVGDRAEPLRRAAQILKTRAAEWALLMAKEMGKPLAQGRAEAEKSAWVCDHYAEHAIEMLREEMIATDGSKSYVRCDPIGLLLAIMPWNFPYWQLFRCAAPALMAGNGVVLKHANNVPGCALSLERIFREAGLPEGLFTTLLVSHESVATLIADRRIAAVTLTGSEKAGAEVAKIAGEHLKKTVLELGGSDPVVVLADADLDRAANVAADSRCINSGQSCIAAKRFIVESKVAAAFTERFRAALAAKKVGDPSASDSAIGPLARSDLRQGLHDQVTRSIAAGAELLLGGSIPSGKGFYYPVTLLGSITPSMAVWREETFGPVAALRVVASEEDALLAANDSPYGLGAALWTRDLAKAERFAAKLEAGAVFINGLVKSDPRLPFGGVKQSGYGRELAWHGIREFVNQKTVWIA